MNAYIFITVYTPTHTHTHTHTQYTKTALFCVITLRVMVIPCRHFGTTYGSHIKGLLGVLTLEDGTDRLSRNVSKQLVLLAA